MKSLLGLFLIVFISSVFSVELTAQLCVSPNQPNLDLNSIDFDDCSGFLTYDITSSSNGLNCTDCGPSVGSATVSENIIVTAYEGGNECESININVVYLDATINFNPGSVPACNQFTFSATTSPSVVGYSWDFDGDGQSDSNSATPTWQFTNSGNQNVTLTVVSSGNNCSYTTNTNVFIDGPWADLSFFGNVEDDEYEELNTISFGDDECTVPFCVDDIEDLHCLHLSGVTHPNANGNTDFEIWVDGVSIYSANSAPVDFEHCLPLDFSGYTTIEYQIIDASGCISFKTYELYVAEDSFPSASVEVDIPDVNGFCIGEFVEFEITADDSNPNDLTYIIAIDCPNLDFNEIINPVMLDTLYLAPGEVYSGQWSIASSSCNCFPSGQYSIYTFMDSPCRDHFPGGTDPFTVNLDSQADFDVPDVLCQNQSYTFSWTNADEMESGICDADAIWSIQGPSDIIPIEVGDDEILTYQFTEVGIYTVCLEIDADCQLVNSIICEDICVESVITNASLDVTWPAINTVSCVGDTYQPSVSVPAQFCGGLNYNWTVSPSGGSSISGGNTANPTITFTDKGNFTIYVSVSSDEGCGVGTQNMSTFTIGAPPQVELLEASIGGCPDQPLCLDAAFCVDDCNTAFISATVTIYQGNTGGGCDYSGLTEVWTASTDPVVGFPFDMLGMECATTNLPCDFLWDVPSDADGDYVAVVEVENACGTAIHCTSISISTSVIPNDDITASVCLGATVDPTLTNFSNCDWLVGGSVVWEPGDGPFVVNSTIDITISCSSSGCPYTIDHQIIVIPPPTVIIEGTTGICAGQSTVLTANTVADQTNWYNLPCSSINGGSVPISNDVTYEVTTLGTYSVVVVNAAGCTACEEVQVASDQTPTFNCVPVSYCENQGDTEIVPSCLQAPPGGWGANPPTWDVVQGIDNVAADIASDYTVDDLLSDYAGSLDVNTIFDFSFEWTSDLGCFYTDTVEVEILNEGVNNDSEEICTNENLTINGSGFGSWVMVDMPASAGADFSGNTFSWTPTDADTGGPYTLEFYPNGGCAYDIITIDVNLSPTVTLTINTDNNGESLCAGSAIDMEATLGFDSYVWYNNLCGLGSVIPGESTFDFSTSNSGSFSILVTDLNGCSACDELTIQTDAGPNFACPDLVYCENEVTENLSLDCLSPPPGGWGATDPVWTNTINGNEINSDIQSPYSLQDILDDLGSELTANSDFNIAYYWMSESGCEYADSLIFTIQNEGIDTVNVNICSGETIDITPDGSNGVWEIDALDVGADITTSLTNFIWNTVESDIGGGNEMVFLSGSGCSSFQYYLEIFETPSGTITPELDEMCLENQINVLLESDNVQNESLIYYFGIDSVVLNSALPIFDPTTSGLNPDNDGTFSYYGWNDYPIQNNEILTCSFTTTAPLDIVDFPESLFFPSTLCEGQEFAPTVCTDPYIDDFELTIDGVLYIECPLEFGELNGVIPYSLVGFYGGDLLCSVDTSGTITIQEQLVIEFTSSMDSCTAEAMVNFEVISGELNGITVLPIGEFVDDIPNQNIILSIDDLLNDQDYIFDFSIDDGGCDVLDFQFEGTYIAPLNPIVVIEQGPFCSGQEVNFELFQTGSNQVDSIIVNPGNGENPYTWTTNFNDPISFVYESPIDSTLFTIDFHLFNICHDTIVSADFIVEPPELVVLIDPYFAGCPGVELDLTPQILGNFDDYQVIVDPDLSLGLVEPPFVFAVNDNQAPGIYDFQINFTPNCGDPISIFSEIEVFTVPQTNFSFDVQCTGVISTFSVDNPTINETYEWFIEGQTQFGENANFVFNSPGDYVVELETTNLAGCSSITTEIITIGGVDIDIPFEPIGQCFDIELNLNTDLDPGQNVHWTIVNTSNGDTQEYFINNQSVNFFNTSNDFIVTYQVIMHVTDENDCSSVALSTVSIYPDGNADIELFDGENWYPTDSSVPIELDMDCNEEEFFFRDGTLSNSCSWSTSQNACSQNAATACPQLIYCANSDDNGWLTLTTVNEYGCVARDEVTLFNTCGDSLIVFIPNAFSPNDDGVNDLFYVLGTNIDPDDFELLIFDRWGEVIYRSIDYTEYWLGNYQDSEYYVPDGVYTYLVKAHLKTNIKTQNDNENSEYKEFRGRVTVIR